MSCSAVTASADSPVVILSVNAASFGSGKSRSMPFRIRTAVTSAITSNLSETSQVIKMQWGLPVYLQRMKADAAVSGSERVTRCHPPR